MKSPASSGEPVATLDREAQVWTVRPDAFADATAQANLRRLLSADERERLARRRRESDRLTFLVARALVRTVLAHHAGGSPADLRFEPDAFGRPRLAFPSVDALAFSLTHTAGLVACVVARDCACGIDAEALDRRGDFARIAPRVLSDAERRVWEALPEPERRVAFLRAWTLKEAYLKARGTGLHISPRKAAFEVDGTAIRLAEAPPDDPDPRAWRFVRLEPTERHTLAVALRPGGTPSPTVVVREGMPGIPTDATTAPRAARPGD